MNDPNPYAGEMISEVNEYAGEVIVPGQYEIVTENIRVEEQYSDDALDFLKQTNTFFGTLIGTDPRFDSKAVEALRQGLGAEYVREYMLGESWGLALLLEHGLDQIGSGLGGGGTGQTTAQKQANALALLRDYTSQLGIQVDDAKLTQIANDSVANNWNNSQITDAVFQDIDPTAVLSGEIKAGAYELRKFSGGLRSLITPEQAIEYSIKIARGEMTMAGAEDAIRTTAATGNPAMADLISSGVDLNTYDTNLTAITNEARQLGVVLDEAKAQDLARTATNNEWDPTQITQNILKNVDVTNLSEGTITAERDKIEATAKQFLLPMTADTATSLAIRQLQGTITDDGVVSMLMSQAKANMPWLSDIIDSGLTPTDYFAPKQEYAAEMLEIGTSDIDLMDANWMDTFTVTENGTTRGATLSEIGQKVRRDSRWQNTTQAKDSMSSVVSAVAGLFGVRGY